MTERPPGILGRVRPPKILAVVSAIDLNFRYGCTPAWWQIWKGLYEAGVDLILTPYRGRALESPWWRTYPNPCYREGELFAAAQPTLARLRGDTHLRRNEDQPAESAAERAAREVIKRWVNPRWRRHLERILEGERDVDAVVVFTVPINHLRGIPTFLRERFGIPVVYYDADVPMSLPEFGGMDTGFNIYHGADPSEYDLFLSNSEGGLGRLRELGARRAEALFWGADPELFAPIDVEKEQDVFFYAYGDKFRRDWMARMIGEPSRELEGVDFALGGTDFQGDVGHARMLRYFPVNMLSRVISASRDQPQRRAEAARDGLRVLHEPTLRARVGRGGNRDEPVRRDRTMVRAGRRAARGIELRRGRRHLPRAPRRPGSRGGAWPASP